MSRTASKKQPKRPSRTSSGGAEVLRRPPPHTPERPTVPLSAAIRMFLIGAIAVIGAAYALWHHYSVPRTPMLVPAPSASEIPAPDLDFAR